MARDLVIAADGTVRTLEAASPRQTPYRLYHFLADLEALTAPGAGDPVPALRERVRSLLAGAEWLAELAEPPGVGESWAVSAVYDEPGFPMAMQLVSWRAHARSTSIHSHGCTAIVACLEGCQDHLLWSPVPGGIAPRRTLTLRVGDVVFMHPDAVHAVTTPDGPSTALSIYGLSVGARARYKWNDALAA